MDPILEHCAGLDVHQETVVACLLTGSLDKRPVSELRTFGTITKDLLALADWLEEHECTHVAMESTGVYWKPIWNVLEGYPFTLVLGNAHRIKNVPGRKTDMQDAQWIAKLLRCGLIESSFVPPTDIRDLRGLTRYRKKLIQDATAEKNRIHKELQDANIKLTTYMSDVFGVSGRNILQMVINGEVITTELLEQSLKGSLKQKAPKIAEALNGRLRLHHRQMIAYSWDHLMYIEQAIRKVEAEIEERLRTYREEIRLISTIPGINETAAAVILAEIGPDMSHFPTAGHLSAWAGVSPGNNESAGKKKRTKTRPGNKALQAILCECAWAASRTRNTRLSARYWSLIKRLGKKKALVATAHTMLRIIYHILCDRTAYVELGSDYNKNKRKAYTAAMLIRQLRTLGCDVIVKLPDSQAS